MAVRLYHRRSSVSKEKLNLQVVNGSCPSTSSNMQTSSFGRRDSLGYNRPRSQSLFPGSIYALDVPPRSRSHSFSGTPRAPESTLTASEEEHIFRCYARVMYTLLGGLAAAVMGLILYGMHSFVKYK